jgi:hypothetical protein
MFFYVIKIIIKSWTANTVQENSGWSSQGGTLNSDILANEHLVICTNNLQWIKHNITKKIIMS